MNSRDTASSVKTADNAAGGVEATVFDAEATALAEDREEARQSCDALWGECVVKAAWAEQEQDRLAREWDRRNARNKSGFRRVLPLHCRPALLRAGLRTDLARLVRHLDTEAGRLLLTVRLAEATLLPGLSASDADEKGRVNALIAHALRLEEAAEVSLLNGHLIVWKQGRRPFRPQSVRLFWTGGKAQGERLLGEFRPVLERLIEDRRRPQTYVLNGREMAGTPVRTLPPRW